MQVAHGQLRVVNYNTTERSGIGEIFSAIGSEQVNGIAKPADIIALQEQVSSATTTQAILGVLNSVYGEGVYARATIDVATTGGGRPGLIYNSHTVQLLEQSSASVVGSQGGARETARYLLRPLGYGAGTEFYVYSSHYKSSDTVEDSLRRNVEALQVRANADVLGNDRHMVFTGDFNIYTSSEPMYQTLLASGNAQAFDPVSRPGAWSSNSAFKDIHTQSPVTSPRYPGQITGGMDDRFDFQLLTAAMLDNEGLSYIFGSYHAFGNTGTHSLNGEISDGSVAALQSRLPGFTAERTQSALTALTLVSDHLPVVADYQLPAKMMVEMSPAPARVIKGAALQVTVSVTNSAPVATVNGADELDYTVSSSGGVSGSAVGIVQAVSAARSHSLDVDTSAVGEQTGLINVLSDSQGVPNGTFSTSVNLTVLDHAVPSFSLINDSKTLLLDFGIVQMGDRSTLEFEIGNLGTGFRASLDFDQIDSSGDVTSFSTDLSLFARLPVGQAKDYAFIFEPHRLGVFNAHYSLFFSDEDLPGETAPTPLTIELAGTAIPEGSIVLLLFLGVGGLSIKRRGNRKMSICSSPAEQEQRDLTADAIFCDQEKRGREAAGMSASTNARALAAALRTISFACSLLSFRGLATVGFFCINALAQAATILDPSDAPVTDQQYRDLGTTYLSVGQVFGPALNGSGTYIGGRWVLTAGHIAFAKTSGSFSLGGSSYSIIRAITFPSWSLGSDSNDIGLVELSSEIVGVTPALMIHLTDDSILLSQTTTWVGYGQGGTGLTGRTGSPGTLRGFTNVIDGFGQTFGLVESSMITDFDRPDGSKNSIASGSPVPTALEGNVAPGDSGGAVFGEGGLVGVISYRARITGDSTSNSDYGELSGASRLSRFTDWITEQTDIVAVPEPSVTILLAIGLIGCLRRRLQLRT